jgi:hypothetical protein
MRADLSATLPLLHHTVLDSPATDAAQVFGQVRRELALDDALLL